MHANTVASKQHRVDVIDTAVSLSKMLLDADAVTFHEVTLSVKGFRVTSYT